LAAWSSETNGKYALYSVDGRKLRDLTEIAPGENPLQWSGDGKSLFVLKEDRSFFDVFRVDVTNRRRSLWKQFSPAGYSGGTSFVITADERSYAYSYNLEWDELNVAEGLK
jgi:hypothetical protein